MGSRVGRSATALATASAAVIAVVGVADAGSPPSGRQGAAAATMKWAWVTVRNATLNGTPDPWNRGNSTGGTNTVAHTAAGRYTVTLPGVGPNVGSGSFLITPFGRADRICETFSASNVANTISVQVYCYSNAGNPANSKFSLSYLYASAGASDLAYFWANNLFSNSYDADALTSYNSAGQANHVTKVGTGHYTILFKGLGTGQGNIQVGSGKNTGVTQPVHCQVGQWSNVAGDVQADVRCTDYTGAPFDVHFWAVFMHGVGLKGDGGTHTAYLFAKQDANPGPYSPPGGRDYSTGTTPTTIYRYSTGYYKVIASGLAKGGAVQVSAFGTNGHRCAIITIRLATPYQTLTVKCTDSGGTLADTKFLLAYEK